MDIYIASKLNNYKAVMDLEAALRVQGHRITYSWAEDWKRQVEGAFDLPKLEVAEKCKKGVVECQTLLLWPAGNSRGSHVEYGIALGLNKSVVLLEPDDANMISFYEFAQRLRTVNGVLVYFGSQT